MYEYGSRKAVGNGYMHVMPKDREQNAYFLEQKLLETADCSTWQASGELAPTAVLTAEA